MNTFVFEIGGSGIRGYLVTGMAIRILDTLDAGKASPDATVEFCRRCVSENQVDNIVVPAPGFVAADGTIPQSTNLFLPPDIGKRIQQATNIPTLVVNDQLTPAIGAKIVFEDLGDDYYIANVGKGLGQLLVVNGQPVARNESGHMPLDDSPYAMPCSCGLIGCAESVIGGASMERRVRWTTEAWKVAVPSNKNLGRFLDEEYAAGTDWADIVYRQFCEAFGTYLAKLILHSNTPAFVMRGTMIRSALKLTGIEDAIRATMCRKLPPKCGWGDNVRFLSIPNRADLPPEYDSLWGAAELARQRFAPK